eukprot:scaffold743_cov267-Pinguiococcus_pyrenoidosus.AAC.16
MECPCRGGGGPSKAKHSTMMLILEMLFPGLSRMEVSALARAEAAGASAQSKAQEDVPRLQWDEFLRKSDIITIHCPLTEQTRNLFDAAGTASFVLPSEEELLSPS